MRPQSFSFSSPTTAPQCRPSSFTDVMGSWITWAFRLASLFHYHFSLLCPLPYYWSELSKTEIYCHLLILYTRVNTHLVTQSCPTICEARDCSLPGSSVHGDSPGKNARMGSHSLLQEIFPTQGSNPGSLPSEPPGMPQNTWVDSLPLFQGSFLTQELNRGLLHCR